jgi:hypothetical protein
VRPNWIVGISTPSRPNWPPKPKREMAINARGSDPARCGLRIPRQQDRAAALDLGRRLRWRVACRRVHPRPDGWSLGQRVADHRRLLHGGNFGWFSPFAVLCGAGVCLGYALLGACGLVKKCQAEIRDAAHRLIPCPAAGLFVFLIVVFAYALAEHLRVVGLWLDRPYLFAFPAVGAIAALVAAASVRRRRDGVPFYMVALIFAAVFGTLAISFWPYMIPARSRSTKLPRRIRASLSCSGARASSSSR